ncbi:hypothetical protein D3C86_1847270 [compost metagenome]
MFHQGGGDKPAANTVLADQIPITGLDLTNNIDSLPGIETSRFHVISAWPAAHIGDTFSAISITNNIQRRYLFNFAFQDGNNDRFGLFACFDNARLPACLVFSVGPSLRLSGCNRLLGGLRHALLVLLV